MFDIQTVWTCNLVTLHCIHIKRCFNDKENSWNMHGIAALPLHWPSQDPSNPDKSVCLWWWRLGVCYLSDRFHQKWVPSKKRSKKVKRHKTTQITDGQMDRWTGLTSSSCSPDISWLHVPEQSAVYVAFGNAEWTRMDMPVLCTNPAVGR